MNDTLYRHSPDTILRICLTHEEATRVLNDCHYGACGGHLSGMATMHKICWEGYFWPSLFKVYMEVVKKFPPCEFFHPKKLTHPDPLHPVIVIIPFSKWGINFVHYIPTSAGWHSYAIVVVNNFTKWAKTMPTFFEDDKNVA